MARRKSDTYELPETFVGSPEELADAVAHMAAFRELAFDTEFVGEDTYQPDLCLIQVATREQLFVIDPFEVGALDSFWALLADPARVVVVHAGREEVRMCRAGLGEPPANIFDVQIAAALVGYAYPIGYAGLVSDALRIVPRKGETLTDWRRRPLSPAQISYAYDDVRYLLSVYDKLQARIRAHDRAAWADEEFASFLRRALADDPSVERWRKLKGLGTLDRRGLAILREVYFWRDAVAARGNRPSRTVLRDDLLIEIARRAPQTAESVASLRGIPRNEAAAIVEAVRRAQALPQQDWPELAERDHDAPHVLLLAQLLGVVMSEWCGRNEVAASIVATTQDLKNLVRAGQPGGSLPAHFPLAAGWRGRSILPELEAFLRGERSLCVGDVTMRHPVKIEVRSRS